MKNLPKMTFEECTIPVSSICCIPSQLEAEAIASLNRVKYKHIKLAQITTSFDEQQICWCAMHNKQETNKVFPVFKENIPAKGSPLLADFIEDKDYIFHNGRYYIAHQDDTYKLLIKEMNIFSTYDDVSAASTLFVQQHISKEEAKDITDIYVARITPVVNPNKQLCVCWFIYRRNAPPFFPIFIEDMQIFYQNDYRTLNWEFLGEGDIFTNKGQRYQVCFDDNDQPYIAKLPKCNMQILSKK